MTRDTRFMALALQGFILTPTNPRQITGLWTRFFDTRSGGYFKEPWPKIFIQADINTAIHVFYNVFSHHPAFQDCPLCGPDYEAAQFNADDDYQYHSFIDEKGLFIKASDILEAWKQPFDEE